MLTICLSLGILGPGNTRKRRPFQGPATHHVYRNMRHLQRDSMGLPVPAMGLPVPGGEPRTPGRECAIVHGSYNYGQMLRRGLILPSSTRWWVMHNGVEPGWRAEG